mmetsp:Transcript_49107/g.154146  ORF Transcript_49107/g.154146 Transcript_49107/m.154146 type:complete len:222 (-) Transcript_49107:2444-3109(-)
MLRSASAAVVLLEHLLGLVVAVEAMGPRRVLLRLMVRRHGELPLRHGGLLLQVACLLGVLRLQLDTLPQLGTPTSSTMVNPCPGMTSTSRGMAILLHRVVSRAGVKRRPAGKKEAEVNQGLTRSTRSSSQRQVEEDGTALVLVRKRDKSSELLRRPTARRGNFSLNLFNLQRQLNHRTSRRFHERLLTLKTLLPFKRRFEPSSPRVRHRDYLLWKHPSLHH